MSVIYFCPYFPFFTELEGIIIRCLSQQLFHVLLHLWPLIFTSLIFHSLLFSPTPLFPFCASNFVMNAPRCCHGTTSKGKEWITVIWKAFHFSMIAILTKKVLSIMMMDGRRNGMRRSRKIPWCLCCFQVISWKEINNQIRFMTVLLEATMFNSYICLEISKDILHLRISFDKLHGMLYQNLHKDVAISNNSTGQLGWVIIPEVIMAIWTCHLVGAN